MIETEWLITNGYVDKSTLDNMEWGGWKFIVTVPAQWVHPFALPTDKATCWARYTQPNKLEPSDCAVPVTTAVGAEV